MRKPLVIGNWKMNGDLSSNAALLDALASNIGNSGYPTVAVCPSFPYLAQAKTILDESSVLLGAQDLCPADSGAFTGEVSGPMLSDLGCKYVLIGHSERRAMYHETDAIIADKFAAAIKNNLTPVLCVGETLEQREQHATLATVSSQIEQVIQKIGIKAFENAVIAYEPVWAIGTGKTATPEQAQEVHAAIRMQLFKEDADIGTNMQILYGGSVNAENAHDLFSQQDIDGGLVGGASLKAVGFLTICEAAKDINS